MEVKKIDIPKKKFKEWTKKFQKELDLFVFGNAFEDEKGNRIDPRNVVYNTNKKRFVYTGDMFK